MYDININQDWTYKEMLQNIEAIKSQVREKIASFYCYETKERHKFMRYIKMQIYSLNFQEWKKDKIIEYIYDDADLELLKKLGG